MKKILIADASKASLVMTSEVFKDHYIGIQVVVAKSSQEAIDIAKSHPYFDAIIVDYDLPDENGAKTAAKLKQMFGLPILLTAFDNPEVQASIEKEVKDYEDCMNWLKKPVNPQVVIAVAQRFCDGKIRAQKRIECFIPALLHIKINRLNLIFLAAIEDCSSGGIKLKVHKCKKKNVSTFSTLIETLPLLKEGSQFNLIVPNLEKISDGDTGDFKDFPVDDKLIQSVLTQNTTSKTKSTLAESKAAAKKKTTEKGLPSFFQEIQASYVWLQQKDTELYLGMEIKVADVAQKFFDCVLAGKNKKKSIPTISSPSANKARKNFS